MDAPVPPYRPAVRAGLVTAHLTRTGGGVYLSVRQFAVALEEQKGIEVDVYGPGSAERDYSQWSPIIPRVANMVGPASFSYAPSLCRKLASTDLDLVHLHGLWMHTSVATLGFTRKTGKPRMVSPHGMLDRWALGNSGWKKRLAATMYENANLHGAACLHALNVAEAKSIRDYGLTAPICVIPNGIHVPEEEEQTEDPWWTKGNPDTKTVLYLGRLHPKKGLPKALAAWSRIDPGLRKQWRFLIAGWDENGHQTRLRRVAAELRIEESVTFAGPLFGADKKAAFQHCDGFILPSVSEGLPMAVLEAWAAGKAVLMTQECNLPEGFEAGAAIRIEADEESMARELTNFMLLEPGEREAMGTKGRELVREKYSWPVIAAEMGAVYRWVAGSGPKPPCVVET